jgi:imidazoleglycerol-phosphate dehydratase
MTQLTRKTRETKIRLSMVRGETGTEVSTGDAFLDHMLDTLARYGGFRLELEATGDLRHHLVEDVGIALGVALRQETPPAASRFGWATVPMDEALVEAAVDLGGRPFYVGPLPSSLYRHFLQSLAVNARATVHIRVIRGEDRHHVVEAAVKALGLAIRHAVQEGEGVFSTKGSVFLEQGEG